MPPRARSRTPQRRPSTKKPPPVTPSDDVREPSEREKLDRLLHWHEAPPWLQFNRWIKTGYRPSMTPAACFSSVFSMHNEWGNIWTSILPAVYFMYTLFGSVFLWPSLWITQAIHFSMVLIYVASTCYHSLMPCCRSHDGYQRLLSCDVIGALASITMSGYSFILYGNRCVDVMTTRICAIFFAFSAIFVLWCITRSKMTVQRRVATFGVHCVVRLLLAQFLLYPKLAQGHPDSYWYHTVSFFVLMTGGIINGTRVPERWMHGKNLRWVDFIGNSHQWWHLCTIGSALLTLEGSRNDLIEYEVMWKCEPPQLV